jgi:uncharacterized membrane protein
MLNDLPAALLVTAVIFDLIALATRRVSFRQAGFFALMAGVVGAGLAVLSGLQAEDKIAHGEAVHEIMETHETLALTTLGIFAVVALWRIFRERRMGGTERALVVLLSVGGAGVLFATGLYGGKLVFEHAAGIPSEVLTEELHERSEGHHHHGGEADEDEHPHDSSAAGQSTSEHVDPPGTPAHTHPPGTPPHKD